MAVAMAVAQPQAIRKAPEQTGARAATVRPFDLPFSGRADVGTLLYLQRTAGNAAVTSLLEAQRRPLHLQRCAGRACDCPEDAVPVQRGFLDDLAGAATSILPEPIKAVLTGSSSQAKMAAQELKANGVHVAEATHAEGGRALESSHASAEATATKTEGEMRSHTEHAHAVSGTAVATGDATTREGESAAVNLQSIGTAAAAVMNPVGPIIELPGFRDALSRVVSALSAIPGGVAQLAGDLKAFAEKGDEIVAHGGIALEEVLVPFVAIAKEGT